MSESTELNPEELSSSSQEKMNNFLSGIQQQNESKLSELNKTLHETIEKVNKSRSELTALDNDFIQNQEFLTTELLRVEIDAEIKSSELQQKQLEEFELIQAEFTSNRSDNQNRKIIPQNDLVSPSKSSRINPLNSFHEEEDYDDSILINEVADLESKKENLEKDVIEERRKFKDELVSLTVLLDNYVNQAAQEIAQAQAKLKENEATFQKHSESLYNDLQQARLKKNQIREKGTERISAIDAQLREMKEEFNEKIKESKTIAEEIKAKLQSFNAQKQQQIEQEKTRGIDYMKFLAEKRSLEKELFKVKDDFETKTGILSELQQKMSYSLGATRGSSFFD